MRDVLKSEIRKAGGRWQRGDGHSRTGWASDFELRISAFFRISEIRISDFAS